MRPSVAPWTAHVCMCCEHSDDGATCIRVRCMPWGISHFSRVLVLFMLSIYLPCQGRIGSSLHCLGPRRPPPRSRPPSSFLPQPKLQGCPLKPSSLPHRNLQFVPRHTGTRTLSRRTCPTVWTPTQAPAAALCRGTARCSTTLRRGPTPLVSRWGVGGGQGGGGKEGKGAGEEEMRGALEGLGRAA